MTTSGAPNSATPTPNQSASPPRPTSPKAKIDPSIPPAPIAAREDADARVARAQEVDRDHHDEDGQAAARERLHDAERRDQREPAMGRDGREPLQHLVAAAVRGLVERGGAS